MTTNQILKALENRATPLDEKLQAKLKTGKSLEEITREDPFLMGQIHFVAMLNLDLMILQNEQSEKRYYR